MVYKYIPFLYTIFLIYKELFVELQFILVNKLIEILTMINLIISEKIKKIYLKTLLT